MTINLRKPARPFRDRPSRELPDRPDARADRSAAEDLLFLEAWAQGLVPVLSAFFRVRQILRANPLLGADWRIASAEPRDRALGYGDD
jgi:hypothetical protein